MNLNLKTIPILLLSYVVVGLLVFMLTRAYYLDQAIRAELSSTSTPTTTGMPQTGMPQTGMPQTGASTGQLIDSLKNHPQINLSDDPAELDRQANEAFEKGDYPKAALLYQRVTELAPMKVEPMNNLGLTLHYLGRSDEALKVLKQGTEVQPEFQRIWLTLGFVQGGTGDAEAARQSLQRAVDLGADSDAGKSAAKMLEQLP